MPISYQQKILQDVSPERIEAFQKRILHHKEAILWLDLELTGLDLANDKIVEIAVIASDMHLRDFLKGPSLVVNPELEREYKLELNEWCAETFAVNGLAEEILQSRTSYKSAQDQICKFINSVGGDGLTWYLAGSSVHVDRQFLCQEMPDLIKLLTHRIIDVTSLAIVSWRWSSKHMSKLTNSGANYRCASQSKSESRNKQFLKSLGLQSEAKSSRSTADVGPSKAEHRAQVSGKQPRFDLRRFVQYDIVRSIELLRFIKDNVMRNS